MEAIQYTTFTTRESEATEAYNAAKLQENFLGGRMYPVGNGFRLQVFFNSSNRFSTNTNEYPLPDGCRWVFVPKCLYPILGIVW